VAKLVFSGPNARPNSLTPRQSVPQRRPRSRPNPSNKPRILRVQTRGSVFDPSAFSLLLRHPEVFGRAVAWDAPVSMAQPNRYGMGDIYGTQENFEHYRISTLLEQHAADLQGPPRLFLLGYGNFRDRHQSAHAWMLKLGIKHHYEDGPERRHHWDSGWVPPAVELLLRHSADN
jgi:hypothetical protein